MTQSWILWYHNDIVGNYFYNCQIKVFSWQRKLVSTVLQAMIMANKKLIEFLKPLMSAYNFPLPVKRPCEFFLPNFPPFFASLLDPIKEELVNCDRLASHSGGGEGIELLDWKWVIVSVFQAFRTSNPEGQPPPDPIQSHLTVWLISVPPLPRFIPTG